MRAEGSLRWGPLKASGMSLVDVPSSVASTAGGVARAGGSRSGGMGELELNEPGSALVGRDREWDEISRLLEGALRGESGVLVVRGEPGVGKMLLLEQAATIGRRDDRFCAQRGWMLESPDPRVRGAVRVGAACRGEARSAV